MKKLLSWLIWMAIAAVSVSILAAGAHAADSLVVQSWEEITTPPFDTSDAERVRIWLPIEREGRCRVRVNINDSLNHPIRRLVDRALSADYYNFYWNKRDDRGRPVPAGTYYYLIDDCGKRTSGTLEARFHPWEIASQLVAADSTAETVVLLLDGDSARVSATVLSRWGKTIHSPFSDSLMTRGLHELRWFPPTEGYSSVYRLRVEVEGYAHPAVPIRAARISADSTN